MEKLGVARQILAYLIDHPDSRDTFDGIVQWWLLERRIIQGMSVVREALAELVKSGWLVEERSQDSRVHYQIERSKCAEIRRLLEKTYEETTGLGEG